MIISNAKVHQPNSILEKASIQIDKGKIIKVNEKSDTKADIDGTGLIAIPGFIDGHIHGAAGKDAMDANHEALETIASALPEEGTTSFLATTMTQSKEAISRALKAIATYENKLGHAEILGIHLEGPFCEKKKAGAQPLEHIIPPSVELFKQWLEEANGLIKTITLAPELDTNYNLIHYLNHEQINVSAGHTDAGYQDITEAVAEGVHQLTHLCNQMNGIHHRDIGAVGAAFLLDNLKAELIADGIHVSPEMIQLIYNNIGSERLLLITDSMRAKYLQDGTYDLGGQEVTVQGNKATLADGTLAGSMLKMIDGVKNMMNIAGATIDDIIRMASMNPAKQIGVYDRKGSIEVGKDADILLLDEDYTIRYTICKGKIAYER
ncbi:N-acetylglucosamine-6-phosphate deacetylase [Gracilibacillus halotolerans]|uniref:N-acetylglucosamine-6-phosphate deacetylase n=1 Tax=Gracilibacillus halotolerans TaxID=74386 RepID=A0A841RJ57_9BACI|nr:N-acetylglucosamine-6-phosphate deacetylase [Gracilibacillus halotolerans]MBB6514290.1 N-acetylglucosamine-6-phosphate deacetylase [Gracilibacillus halotolerans]